MRVATGSVLLLLLLTSAPTPAPGKGTAWPFGGGGGPMSEGRDLYNLGILGAKARDPDAPPPPEWPAGGGRRTTRMDPSARSTDQPATLSIEILYPDGPAAKAGLVVGDVIVGVGKSRFRQGALTPLSTALVRAESGTGKLTLLVRREGQKDAGKVEVVVPTAGKAAAKPTNGAGRAAILDAALVWLAKRQGEDGSFPSTLSGQNGAVVQTSLAGLAWLSGGSDTKTGPYRENVAKAAGFVTRFAVKTRNDGKPFPGAMRGMDQTNWGVAFAAVFLGELQARAPDREVRAALESLGKTLVERQEASGGWAHGPGGPNPLDYLELNIVTGLALCGMGGARHAGWEPPRETIEKADAFLQASSSGDGGIGYSERPGQKGMGNIGRTAASWLGYRMLGLSRGAWCRRMTRYVGAHVDDMESAHASLMMHVFLSGLAAETLGGPARTNFWKRMAGDLVLARAPDGSLQPRPWHETLSSGSNSDVTFGEVWTTAAWAVVLGARPEKDGRPGLPAWTAEAAPAKRR